MGVNPDIFKYAALLFSVLFILAPDLRCSSHCPRAFVALLHSSRHRNVGCGSVSDSLTTGSLTVVSSVLLLQSHFVVFFDSVVRFWLLPKPLVSIAPFVIHGSWLVSSIHGKVVLQQRVLLL